MAIVFRLVTGCSWSTAGRLGRGAPPPCALGVRIPVKATGQSGWKWPIATERNGVPIGWVTAAANRNDCVLLAPTLDAVAQRGLLLEIETLHLDRGYHNQVVRQGCAQRGLTDVVIAQKRPQGKVKTKQLLPLGQRWPVERTNSWFTNYGLLRRSTDRRGAHRQAMMALAAAFILTSKLFIWADYWNR